MMPNRRALLRQKRHALVAGLLFRPVLPAQSSEEDAARKQGGPLTNRVTRPFDAETPVRESRPVSSGTIGLLFDCPRPDWSLNQRFTRTSPLSRRRPSTCIIRPITPAQSGDVRYWGLPIGQHGVADVMGYSKATFKGPR